MSERRLLWNEIVDFLAWTAFVYIIFVRGVIIVWDARLGYPLRNPGVGKARGENRQIEEFALFFGFWSALLAIWLIIRFARRAFTEPEFERKVVCVLVVLVCILQFFMN